MKAYCLVPRFPKRNKMWSTDIEALIYVALSVNPNYVAMSMRDSRRVFIMERWQTDPSMGFVRVVDCHSPVYEIVEVSL